MNRLLVCLVMMVVSVLAVETASAKHGHRVRGHHAGYHAHGIYRAPVARYGHALHHVAPHHYRHYAPHHYHVPHNYRSAYGYPSYGQGVSYHYGHSVGRVYYGGPNFSLSIGF